MTGHLTSQQVTAYRSAVSEPEELLRLDDHLAECGECRSLLGHADEHAGTAVRMLRIDFSSAHLTEAQLDDYAARRPMPSDLVQHLDICPQCRADADDLRQLVVEPAPRVARTPTRSFAIAAAIATLALGGWLATRQHSAIVPVPPAETASKIPPQYPAEVQTAIDSGVLHIPASITVMTGATIQLRSETQSARPSAFQLLSPIATAVIDDTPIFRWTPLEGAIYTISVYDDHFNEIASATGLHVTEWHPDKPFPRGAAYLWEVRAVRGAHMQRAPAATEPEARFAILSAAEAGRLGTAREAMTNEPLAMGILYADAGALTEAKTEFEQALSTKDKSAAEKLLEHLPEIIGNMLPKPGGRFYHSAVRLLALTGLLFLLVTFTPFVNWYATVLSRPWSTPRGDILVVLSGADPNSGVMGITTYWRCFMAMVWYREQPYREIIVTGKNSAPGMRDFFVFNGVPADRILVEDQATNTYENAKFTAALLGNTHGSVVLVTSDYHIFRARRAFRNAGISVSAAGAPDITKRSSEYFARLQLFIVEIRETAAIAYYWYRGWI